MVSYYNPATVAMFGRTGSAHYHHHHSPPSQNPYFGAGAAAYGGYHHPHPHTHPHPQQSSGGSPVAIGAGAGVGLSAVSSAQFSPNMATDFNCNHPQYHPHQFSSMTSDPTPWHQSSMYNSAIAARNALGVDPSAYNDWSAAAAAGPHPAVSAGHPHMHHSHHPSFYHHAQPSPPSSTPSPNSSHPGASHSPTNHVYSNSSSTPNNNNTASTAFKTEFGPCSTGNSQENTSQEMNNQVVVSSGGPSIGAPHSPDSGMAISDGVSSSGSPATGQQYQNNCLGGPSSSGTGSSASSNPSSSASNDPNYHGSHIHHNHHNLGGNNLNQMTVVGHHQSPLLNVSNGRPTQARSPYEWMKKPAYSAVGSSSSNNAKTRTKDKYRVVYSDHQRLELEKEFHYSRYITIRRKAELASTLGLSERQVKIWFQNRRAKERKIHRKRDEMLGREKLATMVHMQNAVAAAGGMSGMGGNPMCNQSNGGPISLPLM